MAVSSYPFDNQAVSEGQFSAFFRELSSHSGVADSVSGASFSVVGDSSGMQVKVLPGFAIVRGHAVQSTATETIPIAAASPAARIDRVVLRLDPTANAITIAVVQGTPGGGVPALTQTDTGVHEFPLAQVSVPVGAATISAGQVTNERRFLGNTVAGWTTSTRPTNPRTSRLGLNVSTNVWEYWDGTKWVDLAPVVTWTSVQGRPATFAPSAHTHPWSEVTDKPATFPPSGHTHDWNSIAGKPGAFPPTGHGHGWHEIWGIPGSFPPAWHAHGEYVTSGGTVAWANGSKKPHTNSASGSGTWYAVWVEGDGTFARNTSSIRFKENVRDYEINPAAVLNLRPVIYDRKDQLDDDGNLKPGRKNEVGLIAEEVEQAGLEWLVNYMDGQVDGLRYDLLGVALVPVVRDQKVRIEALEQRLAALEARVTGVAA
ncbi:tail fiber domain-containing protein [Streptodolium elevatio]|uniref:Tail fiber domain-containing protein n=1 Tax=Streptodolium elevatio TaxID=3157996 RepID=A0ABV3DBW8_9ACTN